jgi:ABC-type transport system involved in cytochrome bd biosynthesis fused ATPase/permease subunit
LTVRDDREVDIEDGGVHADDLLPIAAQPTKQQLALLHAKHWDVQAGKHYAIHGPNGAGKSMLLSAMFQQHVNVHTRSSRSDSTDVDNNGECYISHLCEMNLCSKLCLPLSGACC